MMKSGRLTVRCDDDVTSFLLPLLIFVAWFVLMRFVLPRFGVPT